MGTYAVGDVHGCFDKWLKLKNIIESKDEEAKFIFVGDIVDRGDLCKEMLDWAVANITLDGKYQMVLGNHEEMKLHYIPRVYEEKHNYSTIMEQFNFFANLSRAGATWEEVLSYLKFMEKLPLYKDIIVNGRRFIICHAGVGRIRGVEGGLPDTMNDWHKQELLWSRYASRNTSFGDTIIVHGHTPTLVDKYFRYQDLGKQKLGEVYNMDNLDYNLDCGAVFDTPESNLAALCLDTLEVIYAPK